MEREQFLGWMGLALQAPVQPFAKLSFPLGVILLGTAAQVICQFQTLVRREAVHRALKFRNAHTSNQAPRRGISRPNARAIVSALDIAAMAFWGQGAGLPWGEHVLE